MNQKTATNIVESVVPQSAAVKRLSDREKNALEKSDLSEHASGADREKLQNEARRAVGEKPKKA